MRYVPGEVDLRAIGLIRAELSVDARHTLAHLLNNQLAVLSLELSIREDQELDFAQEWMLKVQELLRELTMEG